MSYAPVGNYAVQMAFGEVASINYCPDSSITATCVGEKRAPNCPDICCPVESYSNATYASVKGAKSLQYWNEKRVRGALSYFLSETPNGSPNPLDEFAYDENLIAPVGLMGRIRRAAANYAILFPASRWAKASKPISDECFADGKITIWEETGHSQGTPQALATVNRLIGITGDTNQSWSEKALVVINSAPYHAPTFGHEMYTKPGDLPEKFFLAENGKAKPRIWLTNFLAVFDPIPTTFTAGAARGPNLTWIGRPKVEAVRPAGLTLLPGATMPVALMEQDIPSDLPPEGFSPWLIAGGLALVGVGAYFLLK